MRRTLLVIGILAIITLSPGLILQVILKSPVQAAAVALSNTTAPLPAQEKAVVGLPVRLKIPSIHVDTALESVGFTPGGEVDVPKISVDAAWFSLSPRPGEEGSAVIVGHYGWKDGIPAVFDDVSKLHKGDELYVEDEHGATVSFIVREVRTYDPNADATEVFDSSDGKTHLNLITCEGVWNPTQKSYSNRLVVFADETWSNNISKIIDK